MDDLLDGDKLSQVALEVVASVILRVASRMSQAMFHLTQQPAPNPPHGLTPEQSYTAGYLDGVWAAWHAAQDIERGMSRSVEQEMPQ